jgi:sugar-specific transcriptional regulator TrmB
MDDSNIIEALTEFGLSTYAARTFVGLQKLGVGSASEIAQLTDVPRSQVYDATEELQELGLVDIQEESPMRYRPIEATEVRDLLYERLHSSVDPALDHLETIQGAQTGRTGDRDAIWTTEGPEHITARIESLVSDADEQVLFATSDPGLIEDSVAGALESVHERGVPVLVGSTNEAVRDVTEQSGMQFRQLSEDIRPQISVGRVLSVDGDSVLISVLPTDDVPHLTTESAFWSEGSWFALLLSELIRQQFG